MALKGKAMRYTATDTDFAAKIPAQNHELNAVPLDIRRPLEAILEGLGYSLIELAVSRHKGSVQVKLVIYNGAGAIGTDDCSKVHRAVTPRLELLFERQDIYLEVSSPGVNRSIKDGAEFSRYLGKNVRCYCTDITEWQEGILESADKEGIVIKTKEGNVRLTYEIIAKAKLDN
ncbi:MAG: ribosome assembly cofactor RimP [Treponema sp.]|jgi:ribosome maturation factor RimP|nr:ribosome assembly cofactor RimP [Treponema sp.]